MTNDFFTKQKCLFAGFILICSFFCTGMDCLGQVSPPGLNGTKLVGWGAVGFNQTLSNRWSVTVYGGGARMSDPDSWSVLEKQAIAVYNQEFLYKFSKQWQASIAQSFRYQNEYESEMPYHDANPSYRYEVRYYGRVYYRQTLGHVAVNYTFRPEFRSFYEPGWVPEGMPVELRFRLRAQFSIPINESKSNQIITGNEVLTAVDEYQPTLPNGHHVWSAYHFTEDRFHIYFKHVFTKPRLAVNLGIMEQFRTSQHLTATSYLAVDLLFQNPFSKM